jgi:chromate reductase
MTAQEAYIRYSAEVFTDDSEVTNDSTRDFLRTFLVEFHTYIVRVLAVLPRPDDDLA